ncbi:MAG: 50S ribosomal protein L21 [Candidatus Spechtbacterales bacterium]
MFAIIKTGGKQYKVQKGQRLAVEKIDAQEGDEVALGEVLLTADGDDMQLGMPIVSGVSVIAKVTEQGKGEKVVAYKYKKRKRYSRMHGHRQLQTTVEILDIKTGGAAPSKSSTPKDGQAGQAKKATAQKTEKEPVATK